MPTRCQFVTILILLAIPGVSQSGPPDARQLARSIDRHLEQSWKRNAVQPNAPATDAEFLRRVTLDLVGRIPTVSEVREYLDNRQPDKREQLVNRLLQSSASARHIGLFWRKTWLPQTEIQAATNDGTDEWLAAQIQNQRPYDQMVRDFLIATDRVGGSPGTGLGTPIVPRSFLTTNENKPENLAGALGRAFLGINLDCAQCHDHPFARWTRDQFWETAAFFATPVQMPESGTTKLAIKIPNTTRLVEPRLLANTPIRWPSTRDETTGRKVLANWVTSSDNPYFARNVVNRLWAYFFGLGLVEPVDDLAGEVPTLHPELLDDLATGFIASRYDLGFLIRAIVLSRAYGLSSMGNNHQTLVLQNRYFARMPVRGLTGEQLYDSLHIAAGLPLLRTDLDTPDRHRERTRFVAQFANIQTGHSQRSIIQTLTMMNGDISRQLTNPKSAPTLTSAFQLPFLDAREKLEMLFLATVNRPPTDDEWSQIQRRLKPDDSNLESTLTDLFWALLNSAEFHTNH